MFRIQKDMFLNYYFGLGLLLLLADQFTKFIFKDLIYDTGLFLSIYYTENFGSAFSLFSGVLLYPYFVILLSFVVLFIFYKNLEYFTDTLFSKLSLVFLVSGIIGNLIDRIIFLHVRDFIFLEGFFIFNFADMYLTIGIILLVLSKLRENKTLKSKN